MDRSSSPSTVCSPNSNVEISLYNDSEIFNFLGPRFILEALAIVKCDSNGLSSICGRPFSEKCFRRRAIYIENGEFMKIRLTIYIPAILYNLSLAGPSLILAKMTLFENLPIPLISRVKGSSSMEISLITVLVTSARTSFALKKRQIKK